MKLLVAKTARKIKKKTPKMKIICETATVNILKSPRTIFFKTIKSCICNVELNSKRLHSL